MNLIEELKQFNTLVLKDSTKRHEKLLILSKITEMGEYIQESPEVPDEVLQSLDNQIKLLMISGFLLIIGMAIQDEA